MKLLKIATISIAVAVLFISLPAAAQLKEDFTVKRYRSKNGLPQNSIRSLIMDENRFLWMTTEGGLVRFDGQHFKVFNHYTYPEILNDRFVSLFKTYEGSVLAVEVTGSVFRIENGTIRLIQQGDPKNPTNRSFTGCLPDAEFLKNGLNDIFDGIQEEEIPNYQTFVFALSPNRYIIRSHEGIAVIDNHKLKKIIALPDSRNAEFFRIGFNVYYINDLKDAYHLDIITGHSTPVTFSGVLNNDSINSNRHGRKIIWRSAYDDVHVKLQNRLYQLESGTQPFEIKSSFVTASLPTGCIVTDAFYDKRSRSLFIGTDSKGLYIFRKYNLKTLIYDDPYDTGNNSYYSQCNIDSNTVLSNFQRAFSLKGATLSDIPTGNSNIECMFRDGKGRFIFSRNDTIYAYDRERKILSMISGGNKYPLSCFISEGDSFIVSGVSEIGVIRDLTYRTLVKFSKSGIDDEAEGMIRGPDGKIWLAMCGGVSRFDPQTNQIETVKELESICARTFYRDSTKVFIGSYGQGLYCWENGKVTKFPLDRNKDLSHIHSFLVDSNEYMWMSTNKGLFRLPYSELIAFIDDRHHPMAYQYFGEDDGILNNEFNGGCMPSVLRLPNGYVSYPTVEGLVWIQPEKITKEDPNEAILIDELLIDGVLTPIGDKCIIPARHKQIQLLFSTPYWGLSYNLNLEYQLVGFNRNWIPLQPIENSLMFSSLPSGNYELQIRKKQFTGSQPYVYAKLGFTVEKKFFETPWFIFLVLFILAGLFYIAIRLNSWRIEMKTLELESKIRERTSELADVNMKLASNYSQLEESERNLRESMNVKDRLISIISHDIITPLKFISMVSRISKNNSEKLEKHKLVESMHDIEFASDKLFNNASNILNWMKFQNNKIAPRPDHIALHDFIDELTEPFLGMAGMKSIRIVNDVPDEDLIVADTHILLIILQNILSNAIKYSEGGTIRFNGKESDDRYFISVQDQGIGMSQNTLNEIERIRKQHGSFHITEPDPETGNRLGYYIIVDFSLLLDGNLTVESEKGKGTKVTVDFPA